MISFRKAKRKGKKGKENNSYTVRSHSIMER